jgi:hypothetical protein
MGYQSWTFIHIGREPKTQHVIEKKSYLLHQFCIRHVQAQDANMVQIIGCEPWFFKNFVFNTRFKM